MMMLLQNRALFRNVSLAVLLSFLPTATDFTWVALMDGVGRPVASTSQQNSWAALPWQTAEGGPPPFDVVPARATAPTVVPLTPEALTAKPDALLRLARLTKPLPGADGVLSALLERGAGAQAEEAPLLLAQADERGPQGPSEANDDLAAADALYAAGSYSDAASAYVRLIDRYPDTNQALWADQGLWNLLEAVESGTVALDRLAAFENDLITYTPATAQGRYAVLTYYGERALTEKRLNRPELVRRYAALSRDWARGLMRDHPSHFLQIAVAQYYYEAGQALGTADLRGIMAELEATAEGLGAAPGRLSAYNVLSWFWLAEGHNPASADLAAANLWNESKDASLQAILDDSAVPYWVKGQYALAIGTARLNLGYEDEAIAQYQRGIDSCPRGKTKAMLAYMQALAKSRQHKHDPVAAAHDFEAFLRDYGESHVAEYALWQLGNIYFTAGDYAGAAAFYQRVMSEHPGGRPAMLAAGELEYLADNGFLEAVRVAVRDVNQAVQLAMDCGPKALRNLLGLQGIEADAQTLARLAGTDQTGTTFAGLVEAAKARGLALQGVAADSADALPTPFIALVDGNHFLTVTAVREDGVAVLDLDKPEAVLSRQEFASRWDGKALVRRTPAPSGAPLEAETLRLAKGGTGDPPLISGERPPASAFTTLMARPEMPTGISSPGVHPVINVYETALNLRETDLAQDVRGELALSFTRVYLNEKGYHRTEYTGTGSPWKNNVGEGWTHAYNMHLRASTGAPPTTVEVFDQEGTSRTYAYDSTSGGYNWYYRSSTGQTDERGYTLKRDTTTLAYTLATPGWATYTFSAATTDANRFARLESIADRSGNTVTLSYDGAVGAGKLTKVASPSGDAQHLKLTYAGALITTVELKANTTVVLSTGYEYNGSNELTKVTDNGGATVQYAYASEDTQPESRFISSITDKNLETHTFAWTFALNGIYYEARKIEVSTAGGEARTFDRSVSTSVTTVQDWNGQTALSKTVSTPVTGDPSRGRYLDSYEDASNYERWGFEYDAQDDPTKQVKPDSSTAIEVSYTDLGRISTQTAAGSAAAS